MSQTAGCRVVIEPKACATTLHSSSIAVGEFLAATNIAMQDSAQLTGRALAQTGVTLIGNTIIEA